MADRDPRDPLTRISDRLNWEGPPLPEDYWQEQGPPLPEEIARRERNRARSAQSLDAATAAAMRNAERSRPGIVDALSARIADTGEPPEILPGAFTAFADPNDPTSYQQARAKMDERAAIAEYDAGRRSLMRTAPTLEELYGIDSSAAAPPGDPTRAQMRESNERARATKPKRPVRPSEAGGLQAQAQAAEQERSARAAAALRGETQGPPLPADVAERERGRAARANRRDAMMGVPGGSADLEAEDWEGAAFARKPGAKVERRAYAPTKALADTLAGSPQRTAEAEAQLLAERQETADYMARKQWEVSMDMQAQQLAHQQAEQARQERDNEIMDLLRTKADLVGKAQQALADTPPEDPGRWWQDQSAGKKVAHVIGAVLGGYIFGNPMMFLDREIKREVEAGRENRRRAEANVKGAESGFAAMQQLQKEMRASALTAREGDLLVENAYWGSVKAQIEAGLAERGITEMLPLHKIMLEDIVKRMAQNQYNIDMINASNVKYKHVGGGYVARPKEQAYYLKQADKARDEARSVREGEYKFEKDVALEQVKNPPPGPGASPLSKEEEIRVGSLMTSDKYQGAVTTREIAGQLLEIADRYGGNAPEQWGPVELADVMRSEDKEEFDRLSALVEAPFAIWVSGATLTPRQEEIVEMASGRGAYTAAERVRAIRTLHDMMSREVVNRERGLSDRARQWIHRNKELESPEIDFLTDKGDPQGFEPD